MRLGEDPKEAAGTAGGGAETEAARAPKTERGRRTLRALLDAAAEEFGEKGFHEAGISRITQRAGVAIGSFYTYFDSKEAIFTALVRDLSGQVRDFVAPRIAGQKDQLAAERAGQQAFIEFARLHKEIYRIIDESEFVDPASYRAHYANTAARIAARLDAAAARGEISPGPAEIRAWAIMGMNVFLGLRFGVWGQDVDPAEVARVCGALIAHGNGPARHLMAYRDLYWLAADGLTLHARDYCAGDGMARLPVICLHGLTRNARDFEALAPWLAARQRRVLAIDVRGRGLSDWDPRADYRLPTYADDVACLMTALGLRRALFIGTSMGGLITMELAAVSPELVAGAVINDVGPVLAEAGLARIASYVGRTPEVATWDDAVAYARWQNRHALPHYSDADWRAMADRLFREKDGHVTLDYDPDIARPFGEGSPMTEPWARWNALIGGRPVLVLRGGMSDLLTDELAGAMVKDHPQASLRIVPGVGHAPMLDEPEALAALDTFLNAVP